MTKPESLPAKTSRDHDYLVASGWRFIGARRAKYGTHYYWDYYIAEYDTYSRAYIQGDAVARQRKLDKNDKAG